MTGNIAKLIESSKPLSQPGTQREDFAGEWVSLDIRLPGCDPRSIGIMVWESGQSRCRVELDEDWLADRAEDQDAEIWFELAADLEKKACEMGPECLIGWLESSASHVFSIGPRRSICVPVLDTVAQELYRNHIGHAHYGSKPVRTRTQRLRALVPLAKSNWESVANPLRWTFAFGGAVAALFLASLIMGYKQPQPERQAVHVAAIKETNIPAFRRLEGFPQQASLSTLPNLFLNPERPLRKRRSGQTVKLARKHLNPATFSAHARPHLVYVAACPVQNLPAANPVDTLSIALPAPPPYRNRDNHLVHFFSRIASPVKRLLVQD